MHEYHCPPDTALGHLYARRIRLFLEGKIDELLDLYAPDGVIINDFGADKRTPLYVCGREALRAFFLDRMSKIGGQENTFTQWAEAEHALMAVVHATFIAKNGSRIPLVFHDSWYLRDGKIAIQFVGTIQYPDHTYADQMEPKWEPPPTRLGAMYREQIACLESHDINGVLHQYADDALLITTFTHGRRPHYVRGRAQLGHHFQEISHGLTRFESGLDHCAELPNVLMLGESVRIHRHAQPALEVSLYDNWVLHANRIVLHFAGVIRYPDGSYA